MYTYVLTCYCVWSAYICERIRDYSYKPGHVRPVGKYNNLFTTRIVCISSTCTLNLVYMADIADIWRIWQIYICCIYRVSYISSSYLFMAILDYYIYWLLQYTLNTSRRVRIPGGIRYTLGRFVIVAHFHAYTYTIQYLMVAISKGKKVPIRNQFSVHNITNTYMFRVVGYIMQHTTVWLRKYILE